MTYGKLLTGLKKSIGQHGAVVRSLYF